MTWLFITVWVGLVLFLIGHCSYRQLVGANLELNRPPSNTIPALLELSGFLLMIGGGMAYVLAP